MNLVDCKVIEIIGPPYKKGNYWHVDVKYDSWGSVSKGVVSKPTKDEIDEVSVGYVFQA